jgi:glucan phosphoethanolaminetransferase (alkaline phosphatase superfamily)
LVSFPKVKLYIIVISLLQVCAYFISSCAVKIQYCGVDENKMLMRMCELQRDEARGNQKITPLRSFIIFILLQILFQCIGHQKKNEFDRRDRTRGRDKMCVDFFAVNLKTWT